MPTTLTIPLGPLVSWGSFSFVQSRSQLQAGWEVSTTPTPAGVLGQPTSFDRAGQVVIPVEYRLTWQYLLACDPMGNLPSLQTQMDQLMAAYAVSQVQQLVVFTYASARQVAGMARLEKISEQDGKPTYKRLLLTFFVPGGLSG